MKNFVKMIICILIGALIYGLWLMTANISAQAFTILAGLVCIVSFTVGIILCFLRDKQGIPILCFVVIACYLIGRLIGLDKLEYFCGYNNLHQVLGHDVLYVFIGAIGLCLVSVFVAVIRTETKIWKQINSDKKPMSTVNMYWVKVFLALILIGGTVALLNWIFPVL